MKSEIQELKTQLGGRISSVKHYDANAKRQSVSQPNSRQIYTNRLVAIYAGRKIEVLVGEELACIRIRGDFAVPLFTVNAKDRIGFKSVFAGKIKVGLHEFEVFTGDGRLSPSQNKIMHLAELEALVTGQELRPGEALHFYRNGLLLYIRKGDISLKLVTLLLDLANIVPAGEGRSNEIELPIGFTKLRNIAQDWALSDDLERADKIENASETQLREFLAAVEPEFEAINSHLEEFDGLTASEGVCNLALLIETAMEVKGVLAHRRGNNPLE